MNPSLRFGGIAATLRAFINVYKVLMEAAEITQKCQELLAEINAAENKLKHMKYVRFLKRFDMKKKSASRLSIIDDFLQENGITVSCGKEQRSTVADFDRDGHIAFRLEGNAGTMPDDQQLRTTDNPHAGKIDVVPQNSDVTLRSHQREALKKLDISIAKAGNGPFAGLLVLPTGGGKTLTAAYWLCQNLLDKGKKILWVAHRHELLNQAKREFERLAYRDVLRTRQLFTYRIISGVHDRPVHIKATDDLIIASKDSLNAGLDYLLKNWVAKQEEVFVVIDEAHHATANTYRKLVDSIRGRAPQLRILGLTATPFRTMEEENGLLAKVFRDNIIYKIDLQTLIARGFLSKPVFESINTKIDFRQLFTAQELDKLKYQDIDRLGDAAAKIAGNAERNRFIVNRYLADSGRYKQTLVFALNKANAIALNALFQKQGVRCDYVLSGTSDLATGATSPQQNSEIIKRFRDGELDVLINVSILTEGTDLPNVQTVFLTRPTISTVLMTQMIGRGLRGKDAGGTAEAYIVSFIDNWQDKVAWVNPEQLFIEENTHFSDSSPSTRENLVRLISISKMEEFALFADANIDEAKRQELESLTFIERLPLGIYHFTLLELVPGGDEPRAKNCEILVYNNLQEDYEELMQALPELFANLQAPEADYLSETQLDHLTDKVEQQLFKGQVFYKRQDVKNVLQFYHQKSGTVPGYLAWEEREQFDVTKVAQTILDGELSPTKVEAYKSQVWDENVAGWQTFFGSDKRHFLRELALAINRLSQPELYQRPSALPTDHKEQRRWEELSMGELRERNYGYWEKLRNQVFDRHRDAEGYYVSAKGGYRSRTKLGFQLDHIEPMSKGGLTTLENLQLLTRNENAVKGSS